jgi:hypothetical protein
VRSWCCTSWPVLAEGAAEPSRGRSQAQERFKEDSTSRIRCGRPRPSRGRAAGGLVRDEARRARPDGPARRPCRGSDGPRRLAHRSRTRPPRETDAGLPTPYSPELNAIERVWLYLRERSSRKPALAELRRHPRRLFSEFTSEGMISTSAGHVANPHALLGLAAGPCRLVGEPSSRLGWVRQ